MTLKLKEIFDFSSFKSALRLTDQKNKTICNLKLEPKEVKTDSSLDCHRDVVNIDRQFLKD